MWLIRRCPHPPLLTMGLPFIPQLKRRTFFSHGYSWVFPPLVSSLMCCSDFWDIANKDPNIFYYRWHTFVFHLQQLQEYSFLLYQVIFLITGMSLGNNFAFNGQTRAGHHGQHHKDCFWPKTQMFPPCPSQLDFVCMRKELSLFLTPVSLATRTTSDM